VQPADTAGYTWGIIHGGHGGRTRMALTNRVTVTTMVRPGHPLFIFMIFCDCDKRAGEADRSRAKP
jgi:hypothetical protein